MNDNLNIELIAQNAIKIITKDGTTIYFDPFKLKNELYDADIIFITHSHFDHFSPEDIRIIRNENTKIVVTKDLYEKSINCGFNENNILTVIANNEYSFGGIEFKTIPAYNTNKLFHKREYDWVSYILKIDDNIVYVAGDTDITSEALNVECDIAFVPVGGTYTMNYKEAAKLVEHIDPRKFAIPTHYQTIVGSEKDAIKFKDLLEDKVRVEIMMNKA